jgi:hypothetical protein
MAIRNFLRAIAAGLLGLLACSLLLAYFVSSWGADQPLNSFGLAPMGLAFLTASLLVGAVLVIFFGAPLFAVLAAHNRTTWFNVLLVGATPGAIVAPFSVPVAFYFLLFGVPIAAFVRLTCGAGSNYVSKRTAGDMLGSSETQSASGRLTRR